MKPFSARELLARVGSQLELARLRRETEQALRYRSEQHETLLNQAPLGVYLVDADFRIREMNPVALPVFGDIPGGVIGRDFSEVIHIVWEKEYADEIVDIFRTTLATGEPYVMPERGEFRADRRVFEYYEWRLDRITLPDGRYGLVCYFRDISKQVHARLMLAHSERELREADRRKDEFLALLAHELRNPLAPIRTGLELIRLSGDRPATVRRMRAMMERQVGHMVRLIDDLLDVSRITSGKIVLQRVPTPIDELVQGAVDAQRVAIEAAGITLERSTARSALRGRCRPDALRAGAVERPSQRGEVHARSRRDSRGRPGVTAGFASGRIDDRGLGHGNRHSGADPSACVRSLRPGRTRRRTAAQRTRDRARARAAPDGDARRAHRGAQRRTRQRQHVHDQRAPVQKAG